MPVLAQPRLRPSPSRQQRRASVFVFGAAISAARARPRAPAFPEVGGLAGPARRDAGPRAPGSLFFGAQDRNRKPRHGDRAGRCCSASGQRPWRRPSAQRLGSGFASDLTGSATTGSGSGLASTTGARLQLRASTTGATSATGLGLRRSSTGRQRLDDGRFGDHLGRHGLDDGFGAAQARRQGAAGHGLRNGGFRHQASSRLTKTRFLRELRPAPCAHARWSRLHGSRWSACASG